MITYRTFIKWVIGLCLIIIGLGVVLNFFSEDWKWIKHTLLPFVLIYFGIQTDSGDNTCRRWFAWLLLFHGAVPFVMLAYVAYRLFTEHGDLHHTFWEIIYPIAVFAQIPNIILMTCAVFLLTTGKRFKRSFDSILQVD